MTVLITGAELIGCHLARRIVNAGDKALLYDLSPNREFIETVAGKDVAIIAADLRDLPALIYALKPTEGDHAGSPLRYEQPPGNHPCPGGGETPRLKEGGLCQYFRGL